MLRISTTSLLMDSLSDKKYNRYMRVIENLFDVPLVLISKVDINRLWFESEQAYPKIVEKQINPIFPSDRDLKDSILVVNDARKDERFSNNAFIVDESSIRFYAGRILLAYDLTILGSVCLMDSKPRDFTDHDRTLLNDMAEIIQEEIKNDLTVYKDSLTTLINRQGFMDIANTTLSVCTRSDIPALLLMFNIKDFKHINKEYGHSEGDELLKKMAYSLIDTFRDSDIVARIADDEFCVLLTDTNEDSVHKPLSRLKEHFESQTDDAKLSEYFGYRFGIVHFDQKRHDSIYKLMEDGDQLMRKQKHKERMSLLPVMLHANKTTR